MHVLYLSYFSPPRLHVAANRSRRFAQYLAQAGCEVQLIGGHNSGPTGQPAHSACWQPEGRITSHPVANWNTEWLWQWLLPYQRVGSSLWQAQGLATEGGGSAVNIVNRSGLADPYWGWIAPGLWQCVKLILAKRPDVILVSCPPFSSSLIGYYLSRWFDLPLVLDFRDGWSRASYFTAGKISPWEKRVLKQAAKLVVTSQSDWIAYRRLVGEDNVYWIPNSYDNILDHASSSNSVFTIGYSGSWQGFRCSAKGILSQLANVPFPFRFIYVGESLAAFGYWVEHFGLDESVVMTGQVEKSQAQEILRQCDALFIQKGSPDRGKTDTHLAAKAIDYVASGRPILAELPEGETLRFLRQYAGCLYEANIDRSAEYQQQLRAIHLQWQQEPERSYSPCPEFYHAFDAEILANRLYRLLNEVRATKPFRR